MEAPQEETGFGPSHDADPSHLQVKANTFYMTPQQLAHLSVLAELMEQNGVFMSNLQQLAMSDITYAPSTHGVSPSPSRNGIMAVTLDDDDVSTETGQTRAPFATVSGMHYSKKILSASVIAHPKSNDGNNIYDVDIGLGKNYDAKTDKLFTAKPNYVFAHVEEMNETSTRPVFRDVAFDTGLQRGDADDGVLGMQENPLRKEVQIAARDPDDHAKKAPATNPVFTQNPTYHPVRKTSRVSDLFH
jgi:hypothetical protein